MHLVVSVGVLASAFALPLKAQEPLPVSLGRGACRSIQNTQECAQAIEVRQLRRGAGRARRMGGVLQLRIDNGRWLPIPHDSTAEWPSWFQYLGYVRSINYYVLWQQHPEGNSIRLVNARNGKATSVDDMPIVSPDHKRFVTASLDLQAGFNPNRLTVWRLKSDTVVQEASFAADDWGPDSAAWLTTTSLRFARVAQSEDGSLRAVARDTVRFVHGKWRIGR